MTVVAEKSAAVRQRPRGKTPSGARGLALVGEGVEVGVRTWTQELIACRRLLVFASVLFALALFADYSCGTYVTNAPAVKVPDLILDVLPTIDLSFLFTYGYTALILGMFLYPAFCRIRMLHVVTIQFSLLLIVRSLFMIFTHVGTPAGAVSGQFPGWFNQLYFENDMFFSGHTAMPFLGFYLFRPRRLRYVYLVGSIVMGIVVLAMHVHYSIDVLGAFFMTYCSYQMGTVLLAKLDPQYREGWPERPAYAGAPSN